MATEEDNEAGPVTLGDYGLALDGVYGLYVFERVEGRGPLPDKLKGRFTDTRYAVEAYNSYVAGKEEKKAKPTAFSQEQPAA